MFGDYKGEYEEKYDFLIFYEGDPNFGLKRIGKSKIILFNSKRDN